MNTILERIYLEGILPVVVIQNEEDALPLAQALVNGGLNCIEITFRTSAAVASIQKISQKFPNLLVGAGTVLTLKQVDEALLAGAQFIVSPGINEEVVRYCQSKDIPIIPGIANATNIETALSLGLDTVKFFPAEMLGGLGMIKALSAPYPNVRFIPTGGLNDANFLSYLSYDKILAIGGSWMVSSELIQAQKFDEITMQTQLAIQKMLGFNLAHVGFNSTDEEEATLNSQMIAATFNLKTKIGTSSIFVNQEQQAFIEVMKMPFYGTHGHIGIGTNNVDRAMHALMKTGVEFNLDSLKKDTKQRTTVVYLKHEMAGFAFHLVQR